MPDTIAGGYSPTLTATPDASPDTGGQTLRSQAAGIIGRRAVTGAAWVLVGFGVSRLLGFLTNLFLARLLSPADFGIVSFAMIAIGACTILQDLGVPAAIIYGRREPTVVGGTALTINVVFAGLLFLVTMLASPLIGTAGNNSQIAPIVTALAIGLLFSSVGSVQMAVLQRELAFRRKTLRDMTAVLASGVVAAVAALLGFGAWSLVLGYLARTSTSTLVLWWGSSYRARPELKLDIARELLTYGGHVSFGSIVGFLLGNVDYFIVGTVLGSTSLGIYTMAFVLATLPSTVISEMVGNTMFPAFSRLRDAPEQLFEMVTDVINVTCLVSVSMGIGILVCAPAYIPIILSQKWLPVIVPLQILTVFGVLRAIVASFTPVYKAVGRPDLIWKSNLVRLLTLAPALFLATRYGLDAVAATHVVAAAPFLVIHLVLLSRALDTPLGKLFGSVLQQAVTVPAVVGALVLVMAPGYPDFVERDPIGRLVLAVAAIAVYGVVVVAWSPRLRNLARVGVRLATSGRRCAVGSRYGCEVRTTS